MLYRALAGQLPVAGGSPEATVAAAARGVHAPLADLAPDAPPVLVDAIERAMARDPEARFASLQQLQVVLEALVTEHEADQWDRLGQQLAPPSAGAPSPPSGPAVPDAPPTGGDSGTRMFGPRPPAGPSEDAGPGRPRWAVPAVVAAVLVPVLVLAGLLLTRGGDDPSTAPSATGTASASPTARATSGPCEGTTPPGPGEVLAADVDGRGCTLALTVTEEDVDGQPALVLTVPAAGGDLAGRYAVAEPGDRVLVGDWDCDGTDTPAVVRDDGTTFLFDGYGALEPVPGPTLPHGAEPAVVTDAGDCDLLVGRP